LNECDVNDGLAVNEKQRTEAQHTPLAPLRSWKFWLRTSAVILIVAVIVLLGARQAREKMAIAGPVKDPGHADEVAYNLMGRGISEGRGIRVDYVSTFFLKYPPTITHREDHWPPFMGYSIAPFVYFMGKETWVARLPGIAYGSIGLPLMTALLAYALSRRGYVALVAGVLMMASPDIYLQSMRTLSDTATAMLVAGFCAAVFLARRWGWMHLAAGFLMACAYYSKGSEILLLGLYPILAVCGGGLAVFRSRWFYSGPAVALLMMAPFWYANWRDYGHPLHTTQNYVAAFFGFDDWDAEFYRPYWGKALPKLSDRWQKHDNYWTLSRCQLVEIMGAALSGGLERGEFGYNPRDIWMDFGDRGLAIRGWLMGDQALRGERAGAGPPRRAAKPRAGRPVGTWRAPVAEMATLAAMGLLAAAACCLPIVLWKHARHALRRHRVWRTRRTIGEWAKSPRNKETRWWWVGPAVGVWLVVIVHAVFLACFWKFEVRLCFPILPLLLALGCAAISWGIEWPVMAVVRLVKRLWKRRPPRRATQRGMAQPLWAAVATLVVALLALGMNGSVYAEQTRLLTRGGVNGTYPFYKRGRAMPMGKWIAEKIPRAVVMCRDPWELLYFMSPTNKGVGLPDPKDMRSEGAEEIFAIARYYGVTHIFVDSTRPSLTPYIYGRKKGLKRVPGAPDELYELDWSALPAKTVEDIWGR